MPSIFFTYQIQSRTLPKRVPIMQSLHTNKDRFCPRIPTEHTVPRLPASFNVVRIIAPALSLYGPSRSLPQSSFNSRKVAALRTGFL